MGSEMCIRDRGAAIRAACSNFTDEHKWEHVSWVAVKLNQPNWSDDDENRFWDKIPEIEYLIKGIKFTWPGQDTVLWTNNVTALRYWLETVRAEVPATAIDRATFDQSFAVAGVEITPTGTIPAGYTRTFPRYTFDMVITADMPLDDIRTEMDFCSQGEVADLGGVLYFYTGTDRTVRYNLDEDDLISIDTIQTGPALQDRINAASMSIDQSVDHDYAEFDVAEIVDQASLDRDGGHKLTQYLGSRPGVKHPVKAMWLLTVALRQARNSMRVAATLFPGFDGNPYAYFALIPGEWVTLSVDEYGFDQKLFQVYSKQINENGSVSVILEEQSRNNFAETIGALPALPRNINIPNRRNVPAVASFRCNAAANTSQDGTIIISIVTTWSNSPFTTHVEMRQRGRSSTIQTITSVTNTASFASVVAGLTYELRARHANHAGYFGAWTAWTPCEVGGDLTPPADPAIIGCEGLLGGFSLNWSPPVDNDYSHTEIHSGPRGGAFNAATFLDNDSSTRYTRFGYATVTELRLWIRHVDRSGNRSRAVFCDVTTMIEGADTTPPADPTGVDCGPLPNTSTLSNGFTVNWDYPTESDYDHTEIWRSPPGGTFAQAVIMDRVQGTQYNRFGFALATALRIWVVHVDRSGNRSREVSCDVTTGGEQDSGDEGGDISGLTFEDLFDIRSPDTLTSGLTDPNVEIRRGWQFIVGPGLTAPFWLRLKRNIPLTLTITLPPMVNIHVTDYRTTDVIALSQQTFTFDSSNWNTFQRFTIATANGSVFQLSGNIPITIDVSGSARGSLSIAGNIQVPQFSRALQASQLPRWIRISSYGGTSLTLNTGRNQRPGAPSLYRWIYNAGTPPAFGIRGQEITSTTPEVTITGLNPNTLYFFSVRSENASGFSSFTNPASFSTTSGATFLLSVEAGADRMVVPNRLIMLNASVRISGRTTDPTTFAWRIVSGTGGRLIAPDTATPSFSGARGSYVVEVTATNGTATATDRLTIAITQTSISNLAIGVEAESGNSYFTTNDRIILTSTFTINNQYGDVFHRWTGRPIAPVNAQRAEAYIIVPEGAGRTLVGVTVDNNGVTQTINRAIDYVDTSFPQLTLDTLYFDPGASATLEGPTPRFPLGDTVYRWNQTAGPRVVLANGNTRRPTFTAPNTNTMLTFEVTATNNGVTSQTYTFDVFINPTRIAVIIGRSNLGGGRYQLTARATVTNGVGDTTYRWEVEGAAMLSDASSTVTFLQLTDPTNGNARVRVVATNNGLEASASQQLFPSQVLPVIIQGFVNDDGTVQLDVGGIVRPVGQVTYAWEILSGDGAYSDTTIRNPILTTQQGNTGVRVTVTNEGRTATATLVVNTTIIVSALISSRITRPGQAGVDVNAFIIRPVGTTTYRWGPDDVAFSDPTTKAPVFPLTGATEGVQVTVTNNGKSLTTPITAVTSTEVFQPVAWANPVGTPVELPDDGSLIDPIQVPEAYGTQPIGYSAIRLIDYPSGLEFDPSTRTFTGRLFRAGSGVLRARAINRSRLGTTSRAEWTATYQTVPVAPFWADDSSDVVYKTSRSVNTVIPEASGSTATYSVVGTLPDGLSFNPTTRTITGMPTTVGSGAIVIRASNPAGQDEYTVNYTIERTIVSVDSITETISQPAGEGRAIITLDATVTVTDGIGPTTYLWRELVTTRGTFSDATIEDPVFTYDTRPAINAGFETDTVWVELTATNNGVSDSLLKRIIITLPEQPTMVEVTPLVVPPQDLDATSPIVLMGSDLFSFMITNPAGPTTYRWNLQGEGDVSDTAAENPTFTFTEPGRKTIFFTVQNHLESETGQVEFDVVKQLNLTTFPFGDPGVVSRISEGVYRVNNTWRISAFARYTPREGAATVTGVTFVATVTSENSNNYTVGQELFRIAGLHSGRDFIVPGNSNPFLAVPAGGARSIEVMVTATSNTGVSDSAVFTVTA